MTDGDTSTRSATQLPLSWSGGDRSALEQMLPQVYEEVHRQAALYLSGERPDHSLVEGSIKSSDVDPLALQPALNGLTALDARIAKVVELRFLGDLRSDEVAELLELSRAMVKRDWSFARAWLFDALEGIGASE